MKPTYELFGVPFKGPRDFTCFPARLTCECTWDDLDELVGVKLGETELTIAGVERFAVPNQSFRIISLACRITDHKTGGQERE
jgi:hypothetical protein